ncbi:MAG: hypothetical protein QOH91_4451, partial [Mycobacterium sp.]|nr:hypothetical protein [Mycobacterium sp.]
RHLAAPEAMASSAQHHAHILPTGHSSPAAVTIQAVCAAGTRRTSSRASAESPL